jgi:hypothetical protein
MAENGSQGLKHYLLYFARLGNFLISCISFLEILYLVCGLCSLKLASYDMAILPSSHYILIEVLETVKMFPGLEERFISKADIPDDLWDSLNKMAEKGKIVLF